MICKRVIATPYDKSPHSEMIIIQIYENTETNN